MARKSFATLITLLVLATYGQAQRLRILTDEFDDWGLVRSVSENEEVKAFRMSLVRLQKKLGAQKELEIDKLLGKPAAKPRKTYAIPVAQPRAVDMGLRFGDSKDHTEFYAVKDFAGVEVHYVNESPLAVFFYLKADERFPRLTDKNLSQRLDWDREHFTKLVRFIGEREKDRTGK